MGSKITAPTINDICNQVLKYQPDAPIDILKKAYEFACKAHEGQYRASGEEYICHPLGAAYILTELQIDALTVSASLLHDVVEDTDITLEDLEKKFNKEISMMVDGVTKLSRFEYKSKEDQKLENYQKMFLAMAKDIRVVLIKLADRLHNMRTLTHMAQEKQKRIAQETMEIFAPLVHRLGIFNMKWELEDLAFSYLDSEKYHNLAVEMKENRQVREEIIYESIVVLTARLKDVGIKAEIQGRPKHLYSIYKKMIKDNKGLNEIYDLYAIRVIVDNIKDCYGTLGIVHTLWKPLPYRFKDYIAMPKTNMYQSLHTTVIGTRGQPVEIQIRTWDMHRISEYGIAAHWRYKEGNRGADKDFDGKISWLRQLLEWQQDLRDPREFVDALKLDVFTDEVFVFTPKGDVINLPTGSVPIDFAYRVHTDVGHRCTGARINGKIVPLDTRLNNGDIVEVITSKTGGPSRDWINIVGSSETRNKIRQWFKKEHREENIIKGREMLEKDSKRLGYDWKNLLKSERLEEVAKKMNVGTEDDLLASLGYGGVTVNAVMTKLLEIHKKTLKSNTAPDLSKLLSELKPKNINTKASQGILVKGESGLMIRLARCCNPVPGDPISGYITKGRGVSVHRADCINILNDASEYERLIEVSWDINPSHTYKVTVEISGSDRAGLFSDIMMVMSESKTNISTINAKVTKNKIAVITVTLDIKNLTQLEYIMSKLRRVKNVFNVYRVTPSSGGQV